MLSRCRAPLLNVINHRVAKLMDAGPDYEAGAELNVLATLVDTYQAKHFLIDSPDPVEAIQFLMDWAPPCQCSGTRAQLLC